MAKLSNSILLAGGAALVTYFLLAKKQAVNILNYYVKGISINFDGFTPVLTINLAIQNVSNQSFTIKSLTGLLYNNGKEIGNINSFDVLEVPPVSEVYYKINVRLNLISVVSDLISVIQQKSGATQNLSINAWINAGGLITPININYSLP